MALYRRFFNWSAKAIHRCYNFRLVFISKNEEMKHLCEYCYPDIIQPSLVRRAGLALGIPREIRASHNKITRNIKSANRQSLPGLERHGALASICCEEALTELATNRYTAKPTKFAPERIKALISELSSIWKYVNHHHKRQKKFRVPFSPHR